jgi:hypothetical protein
MSWLLDKLTGRKPETQIARASDAHDTIMMLSGPRDFVPYDLLMIERTNEMVRLDEVLSEGTKHTTVAVTRGLGSTPWPVEVGDVVLKVGCSDPDS